jgi:hypothetical protein
MARPRKYSDERRRPAIDEVLERGRKIRGYGVRGTPPGWRR